MIQIPGKGQQLRLVGQFLGFHCGYKQHYIWNFLPLMLCTATNTDTYCF